MSDAPERFRAAFDAFISAQLGLLLFDPVTRLREEPRVASVAEAFFRRHAETPYGRQVHKSLLHGLRTRISTSQASALETDVYERIETNESIRRGVGLGPRR